MNAITGLGKYIFAIPMLVFGLFHFMNADAMAGMAPFGGAIIVYLTGACLIAFALSVFIGKYDKLAAILLAIFLLLTMFMIFLKGVSANDQTATTMFLIVQNGQPICRRMKSVMLCKLLFFLAKFLHVFCKNCDKNKTLLLLR